MKKLLKNAFSALAGFLLLTFGYFLLGQILNLIFSPPAVAEPLPTEPVRIVATAPTEPPPTRVIVGYTSDDEPVYEDQIYTPEPFYYDEYGAKYILVDGTYDEYYMDEDYREEIETPESSAFTMISYQAYYCELVVRFRESGDSYIYYHVEPDVWYEFKNAGSKGTFFHERIKDQYEYDRE